MESILAPSQVTDFINQRISKFDSSSSSASSGNSSNGAKNAYRSQSHNLTYSSASYFLGGLARPTELTSCARQCLNRFAPTVSTCL